MLNMAGSLTDRLRQSLQRAGLKQADLAAAVGISRGAVSLWFNGSTGSISGDNLTRAARALGVDTHWLATGENSPTGKQGAPPAGAPFTEDELALVLRFRTLPDELRDVVSAVCETLARARRVVTEKKHHSRAPGVTRPSNHLKQ